MCAAHTSCQLADEHKVLRGGRTDINHRDEDVEQEGSLCSRESSSKKCQLECDISWAEPAEAERGRDLSVCLRGMERFVATYVRVKFVALL